MDKKKYLIHTISLGYRLQHREAKYEEIRTR